ncbi:LysR family transcriptional regulator, partial [Acinetobacter baumannii]
SHRAFEEDPRKTLFLEWLKAEMNESQHKLL